jgi:CubicO group peptidase (beta-lactamase class C family)
MSKDNIARMLDLASVPALSMATFGPNSVTHMVTVGRIRADGPEAGTETLFEAASLTKTVFAVTVLLLARQGRINLDVPIHTYMPLPDDTRLRRITARHILSHSSGLPNWRTSEVPLSVAFEPGSKFQYSGEGYFLLQRAVEAITGRTSAQLVREVVLDKLGMASSSFGWSPTEAPESLAWPHDAKGKVIEGLGPARFVTAAKVAPEGRLAESWTFADQEQMTRRSGKPAVPVFMFPNMAWSMWTTAADFARFLIFARSMPELRQKVIPLKRALFWSLGWGIESSVDGDIAWQWGDNGGYKNVFVVNLATGRGIVILTNGDGGAKIYRQLLRDFVQRDLDFLLWI